MFTINRKVVRQVVAIGLPALIATMAAAFWPPERLPLGIRYAIRPLHLLEWQGYDLLFRWRGPQRQTVDPRIVVVGYDTQTEGTIEVGARHPWPPPRRFHARVVDNLTKDGAKVILFDVLMANQSKDPHDDLVFDKALSRSKNVVLACRVTRGDTQQEKQLISPYYDDKTGVDFERDATIAFADVVPDSDSVVRRLYPLQRSQGEWLPSLSAAAVLALNDHGVAESKVTPNTMYVGGLPVPRTGPTVFDPVDPENQMGTAYMDFPAGLSTFPLYRYDNVFQGQFPPGTFTGKAVFIGVTGVELTQAQNDAFITAYSRFTPEQSGGQITRNVYGVVVQAQMANALLGSRYFRQAKPWEIALAVFGFGAAGMWGVRSFLNWRGPVILCGALFGYLGLSYVLFTQGRTYLPWIIPGTALLLSSAAVAWFERGEMKRKWAGYVSPAYLEAMLREGFESAPRRHEATVVFGDIRGFTSFSEKHAPEMVVRLLDKHLEKLVRIVFEENGTVDKFLGDGIMAVFGAPALHGPEPDAAVRAVRAAWRMRQAALESITDEGQAYTFYTGFGITTGPLVAGHVGSKELSSFTLIGDTVNLAARLQAVTGEPDVILDGPTYELVKDHVVAEEFGELGRGVKVKGKEEYVACFVVREWRD